MAYNFSPDIVIVRIPGVSAACMPDMKYMIHQMRAASEGRIIVVADSIDKDNIGPLVTLLK